MDTGDVYLADLNEEQRRRVIVLSASRFTSLSGRVIVVPALGGMPDEVPDPWRVQIDGHEYAVDHVRSVSVGRLVDHIERAPASAVVQLRRSLRAIT